MTPCPPTRMLTIVEQMMTGPTLTLFTGDRAQAQQFLIEFSQLERANLRHVLITRPALQVELALSFIHGPLTDPWRQTVQCSSPGNTEDEELWDKFYNSFCTAWTDDLPVSMPQTPLPLAPIDASPRVEEPQVIATPVQTTAVPSPNAEDDLDFKEFYPSYLDDNVGIFSPRAPTLMPPPSIFDLVRPSKKQYTCQRSPPPLLPTLPDADEDWTLFAPCVVSVPTPFVSTLQTDHVAQRVEKRQRDYTSDEAETRRNKCPRLAAHTGPPCARPQLGRRSVPLPRKYAFAPRWTTSAPITSTPRLLVPYSPPPRQPPGPPDDPGPPVPAALPLGRHHTIVEDNNNRRGGVKTLDSSVFAPDVAVSPTPTPVLDSPRPPTPHTPPPRRPDIFPRLTLEIPRNPDSLATHPTNSRRHRNAHPRTPAQTTTTTVDPVNTPPTCLTPISAQDAVDSPPQTPPHTHLFPRHAFEGPRDPDELATRTTNRQRCGNARSPYPATSRNHDRHARQAHPTTSPEDAMPTPVTSRLVRRRRRATAATLSTSPPPDLTATRNRDRHVRAAHRHPDRPTQVQQQPDRQRNRANAAVEVFLEQYDAARTTSAPTPICARRTYNAVMQHLDLRLPKKPDTTGITQPFALKVGPSAILRRWKTE
ncbi:hypothetical protein EDB83DRAFT_2320703 [Lactarius deliciosus]|nr:hypothetical protein EDB83DRAFT_2320703 [Lactarius deliciosus]